MECSQETWDKEPYPNTRTLYYCGKSEIPNSERVFHSPQYNEDLSQLAMRTLEAFEYSLTLDWDFMARPHSSTYVHKPNLVAHIETLPKTNLISGLMTSGPEPFIWGGGHYIFSRDVIERIVEQKEQWRNDLMEDGSITVMSRYFNIPVHPGKTSTIDQKPNGYDVLLYNGGENFSFTDFAEFPEKAKGHFYVRLKQDFDRSQDLLIMRELDRVWK